MTGHPLQQLQIEKGADSSSVGNYLGPLWQMVFVF